MVWTVHGTGIANETNLIQTKLKSALCSTVESLSGFFSIPKLLVAILILERPSVKTKSGVHTKL